MYSQLYFTRDLVAKNLEVALSHAELLECYGMLYLVSSDVQC